LVESNWFRFSLVMIALAAAIYLAKSVWELAGVAFDVILVIFLAWILAAVMRRLVLLVRRFVPRPPWIAIPIAYLIVLLPIIALISLVVPLTLNQALGLSEDLPILVGRISEFFDQAGRIVESFGLPSGAVEGSEEDSVTRIGTIVAVWVSENAVGIVQGATTIVLRLFFVIALSVYMVVEGHQLTRLFYQVLPGSYHRQATTILRQLDHTFFSYLRGVFTIAGLYSIVITMVMFVAELPFALPLGLASGFIQLVPIVGEVASLGIPILVALVTKPASTAVLVAAALIAWSLFMNNLVLPRVLGNAVRMPGLFVLLAVVLGSRMAGAWGAILGVPVAGFLYALMMAWIQQGSLATPAGRVVPGRERSQPDTESERLEPDDGSPSTVDGISAPESSTADTSTGGSAAQSSVQDIP
jgi:predicted PurR-regulated permease PerM